MKGLSAAFTIKVLFCVEYTTSTDVIYLSPRLKSVTRCVYEQRKGVQLAWINNIQRNKRFTHTSICVTQRPTYVITLALPHTREFTNPTTTKAYRMNIK